MEQTDKKPTLQELASDWSDLYLDTFNATLFNNNNNVAYSGSLNVFRAPHSTRNVYVIQSPEEQINETLVLSDWQQQDHALTAIIKNSTRFTRITLHQI